MDAKDAAESYPLTLDKTVSGTCCCSEVCHKVLKAVKPAAPVPAAATPPSGGPARGPAWAARTRLRTQTAGSERMPWHQAHREGAAGGTAESGAAA
jgi:hypothetical protein